MPLKVHRFEVYLNDPEAPEAEPVCHEVRVLHIDQLMAEVAFTRAGFDMSQHGMNLSNAWCWAACQRLGFYPKDRPWQVFRATDCAGIQGVGGDVDVDPTPPSPGGDSA